MLPSKAHCRQHHVSNGWRVFIYIYQCAEQVELGLFQLVGFMQYIHLRMPSLLVATFYNRSMSVHSSQCMPSSK